ncbi:MAG: xanthine dehydrogenase family protein molybdopterin-binding subunit, partial [Myxococcota bacterium]
MSNTNESNPTESNPTEEVAGGIGVSVKRKEDRRFITGKGRYTDDINLHGQTYAVFVRSPHAHAEIVGIDVEDAQSMPGVVAIFTGQDVADSGVGGLICGWQIHSKDGSPMIEPPHPILAHGRVRHVGDPVAVVIAETLQQAQEAALNVDVDYTPIPSVIHTADAMSDDAPQIWEQAPKNMCYDWELGDKAATEAAFENAAHVVSIDLINQRLVPNAIEPRAALASYDVNAEEYTLYTTSQNPHLARLLMGAFVLGIPEHKLKLIAPDVGGGFGSKIFLYNEETALVWASSRVKRPIKWTATRSEAFVTDAQGRDHVSHAKMALDAEGRFLGLRVNTVANLGAYLQTFSAAVPTYLYGTLMAGCYTTPAIYVDVQAVFTNTVSVDAYRGAGRPEALYLIERLVDACARETGIDRVEIRRKNFIPTDAFPYATPVALTYDSGDYHGTLDRALELADWDGFSARKAEAKTRGMLRGIGMSTYVEACGLAPSQVAGALGARAGLYESGSVRVHPTGSVTIYTGTHSHGQGHETTFAQIIAERLGVSVDSVEVVHGDTSKISFGMGTYGSRSLAVGGSALYKACDKIIAKGKKIAAHLLEANEADIVFEDGKFSVTGTDQSKTFGEIALTAYVPHNYPEGLEPGLDETAFYDPTNFTYPAGAHIVEVEIDPDTGVTTVVNVTAVEDVGRIINPMIVEGQIHGGLAQGIGQALLEQTVYDDQGQLLTGSYMNYTMPRAADLPFYQIDHHITHCEHNPLGSKGCGEMGAIGVPPAVINAVVDALSEYGITNIDMPATPEKVWRAI